MEVDVPPLDETAMDRARDRQRRLTKPPGSLGRLEELSVRIAGMVGDSAPSLASPVVVTMAGDHGVVAEGVSAFPASVTAAMVENIARGGAAVDALARSGDVENLVVDVGVAGEYDHAEDVVREPVAAGTANFAEEPAMTREEAIEAIEVGRRVVADRVPHADVIGLGDMGIGNTTASAAVTAAITGVSPEEVTGRGTGVGDDALARKVAVVREALEARDPDPDDGIDVLRTVGGFELAGLAGVSLEAASRRIPVVVDGFVTGAAALAAAAIDDRVSRYLLPSHRSVEDGHDVQLEALGLSPLFDLEMRLGEGTGAVLAMSVYRGACATLREMATFEEAGIPR
ncbi:MAG: nicotinate-nucleotide--dimethylbenzimidazole phosphoribosyltransferase [Haloferacaceae archaeon]